MMKNVIAVFVLLTVSLGIVLGTPQPAFAEDATHGANGLVRRTCPGSTECTVNVGESVVGAVVTQNGVEKHGCFISSASSGVKVRDGAINYWSGEITGKGQCDFGVGSTPPPASSGGTSGTVNGRVRIECPSGRECSVPAGDAVVGQSVWFKNVRHVNCFALNVPAGVTVKDGGVINYWLGEPERHNSGQCGFGSGSTTQPNPGSGTTPQNPQPNPSPATAGAGTITGQVPSGHYGLVVFGGGSTQQLVIAARCPGNSVIFWSVQSGRWAAYVEGAPNGVNRDWNARYSGSIPANTPLVARCL